MPRNEQKTCQTILSFRCLNFGCLRIYTFRHAHLPYNFYKWQFMGKLIFIWDLNFKCTMLQGYKPESLGFNLWSHKDPCEWDNFLKYCMFLLKTESEGRNMWQQNIRINKHLEQLLWGKVLPITLSCRMTFLAHFTLSLFSCFSMLYHILMRSIKQNLVVWLRMMNLEK
jgi:hypothetical protein